MFNNENVNSMEGLNNEKFKIIEMRTKKHRAHKASPNKTEQTHKKHISNYTNKTGKKASTRTACKKKTLSQIKLEKLYECEKNYTSCPFNSI